MELQVGELWLEEVDGAGWSSGGGHPARAEDGDLSAQGAGKGIVRMLSLRGALGRHAGLLRRTTSDARVMVAAPVYVWERFGSRAQRLLDLSL